MFKPNLFFFFPVLRCKHGLQQTEERPSRLLKIKPAGPKAQEENPHNHLHWEFSFGRDADAKSAHLFKFPHRTSSHYHLTFSVCFNKKKGVFSFIQEKKNFCFSLFCHLPHNLNCVTARSSKSHSSFHAFFSFASQQPETHPFFCYHNASAE